MKMPFEQAIEVFVRGYAFTKSYTHPYLVEEIDGVWVMRDAPRRSGDHRKEEFVFHGLNPSHVDILARRITRGRFFLCAMRTIDEPDAHIREQMKALKYRLLSTEPLFIHDLHNVESCTGPLPIERVLNQGQADRLAQTARGRQILPHHLVMDPPPVRQYVCVDGDTIVGWVQSIAVCGAAWCSNMLVSPAYRRRGIARALLTRMLQDDHKADASASVLLASHAGAKLYPKVGYQQIGELMIYAPIRT